MARGIPPGLETRAQLYDEAILRITPMLDEHPNIVLDDTLHFRRFRHQLWDAMEDMGLSTITVWVRADEEIILERLRAKPRPGHMLSDPIPLHEQMVRDFEDFNHATVMCPNNGTLDHLMLLPYYGAGRWRMGERDPWWRDYRDETPMIIGHFWRGCGSPDSSRYGVFDQDVLAGVASHDWMGLGRNVYCIDCSVGQRHLTRVDQDHLDSGHLAALSYPDWPVIHDDGTVIGIGSPGLSQSTRAPARAPAAERGRGLKPADMCKHRRSAAYIPGRTRACCRSKRVRANRDRRR